MSRLAQSNKHNEIIAVVCTANFDGLITEELTHATGPKEQPNSLVQIVSNIGGLNE